MSVPPRPMLPILLLCAGTPLLHGQSMVEHGIIDGKTAAGAAAMGGSVVGVLRQMGSSTEKTAKVQAPPAPTAKATNTAGDGGDDGPKSGGASSATPKVTATRPNTAAATPANFASVSTGMEREELLKLFGKPSMSVSGVEAHILTETYWYQTPTEAVTVILHDGKVFSITRVDKSTAK